jgi:hypothetical protein
MPACGVGVLPNTLRDWPCDGGETGQRGVGTVDTTHAGVPTVIGRRGPRCAKLAMTGSSPWLG